MAYLNYSDVYMWKRIFLAETLIIKYGLNLCPNVIIFFSTQKVFVYCKV